MPKTVNPSAIAEQIKEAFELRLGSDHEPWRYEHGVWKNCTEEVRKLVYVIARDDWTKALPDAVLTAMADSLPPLPPSRAAEGWINFRNGWVHPSHPAEVIQHEDTAEEALAAVGGATLQVPHDYGDDALLYGQTGAGRRTAMHTFIEETWPGDPEAQSFAWEALGYFLMPSNPFQQAFMLYGSGANGKSIFLDVLTHLLGPANVSHVTLDLLTNNNFAAADLLGKMANMVSEMPAKFLSDTGTFKMLTGSDRIRGEKKHRDPFWFYPTAKHAFSVNELPGTSDASYGYQRRWIIFPFLNTVPPERRRPPAELMSVLTADYDIPAILREAVEALGRLLERGHFSRPASFTPALEEFRTVTFEVLGYVEERLVLDPEHRTKRSTVYKDYTTWVDNPTRALRPQQFYAQLRAATPVRDVKVNGVRYLKGCAIGTPEDRPGLPIPDPEAGELPASVDFTMGDLTAGPPVE